MTPPLKVTVESMRSTASDLADLASGFFNDGAGPALAAAAAPVSGLDSGSACREVGDAFLRHAQTLGDAASVFSGKLDSAAALYERGDSEAAERIEFDPPEEEEIRVGDDPGEPGYDPVNDYEDALHEAGLLEGPSQGFYREWLANAANNDVPPEVIVEIARRHNITPQSFDVLKGMERVTDDNGTADVSDDKTYFLLPKGVSAEDAKKAVLMTYILNAGTGYGSSDPKISNPSGPDENDFAETPYTAEEVQRIIDRQNTNGWSYAAAEHFTGRLTSTPNGMLMGLGGNLIEDPLSQQGGSTYGDVFLVNIDDPADPAEQLRTIISSGRMWYDCDDRPFRGALDLDRILHHEERHSQQWAHLGFKNFVEQYGQKMLEEQVTGSRNPFEDNAGASDGGYH
ncbi:ESX-1 secretion-associated protein [Mycolicibacterium houstonense]|uniref:ESX-1 secretion-associated protein n=1 Tax=Mycolicibacterium houstonense TaxID=146021 RepID=UPI003F946220